jgi:hypothetical protein
MQINGSNSNSLHIQPPKDTRGDEQSNYVIDVTPVVVESNSNAYLKRSTVNTQDSIDSQHARYVRTFASQPASSSTLSLFSNTNQSGAVLAYKHVEQQSSSSTTLGKFIDEVV